MTDMQKLNVKDFMDRIIYLHAQATVCREFAPVKLIPFETVVHLTSFADFAAIQDIYKVDDYAIEIKDLREDSCPSVHYEFNLRGVRVLYVALEGKDGFDLPKKESANA